MVPDRPARPERSDLPAPWARAALGCALAFAACQPDGRADTARGSSVASTASTSSALTADPPPTASEAGAASTASEGGGAPHAPAPHRLPFMLPFAERRRAYVVPPVPDRGPGLLMVMLHGVCSEPAPTCAPWAHAAAERGLLVCPEGDGVCEREGRKYPTWNAPAERIAEDIERAVAAAEAELRGRPKDEGTLVAGFSWGADLAASLAQHQPGRWRYLVIVEGDVVLSAELLRRAGVRAVALLAGGHGSERTGEERTAARLVGLGYPARFWPMPHVAHEYSKDIEDLMRQVLDWLVSPHEEPDAGR